MHAHWHWAFQITKWEPWDLPNLMLTKDILYSKANNKICYAFWQLFEVRSEDNPINIAYSNIELDFHMDLVYYESPPGLQLLHCVRLATHYWSPSHHNNCHYAFRNDECVKGGESVMLDAFFMAEQLRSEHPDHFKTLTRVPATFQKIHYDRLVNVHVWLHISL